MKARTFIDPIDQVRQLRFKYIKESNYQLNKHTKQFRRTTRQLINKYKSYFRSAE
jgi:hypothetical protein